jgi:hypothetical protein
MGRLELAILGHFKLALTLVTRKGTRKSIAFVTPKKCNAYNCLASKLKFIKIPSILPKLTTVIFW